MPANGEDQDYEETGWHLIEMLDLSHYKEVGVSYGMYSPYVKQIVRNWDTQNRIIPQDWKGLVTVASEAGPQLQWWMEE